MRQHVEMLGLVPEVPEAPATGTECREGFPTFLKLCITLLSLPGKACPQCFALILSY